MFSDTREVEETPDNEVERVPLRSFTNPNQFKEIKQLNVTGNGGSLFGTIYIISAITSFFIFCYVRNSYFILLSSELFMFSQILFSGVILGLMSNGISNIFKIDICTKDNFILGFILGLYIHFLIYITWSVCVLWFT